MGIWGFNFVALKLVLVQMSAPSAALVRALLMYGVLVCIGRWRGISLRFPPGTFWRINLQGFLAMGLYMILFVEGMREATPAEGAIILGCGPVFTLLIACLAGQETFHWSILGGTLFAFVGVGLVVGFSPSVHSSGGLLLGHFLLLASAFVWAGATVVSRPIVTKVDPLQMLTLSMPAGLAALLPYGVLSTARLDWAALTPTTWAMMAYFAVAAGVIGFLLFYRGVQQVGASGAMLYQYLVSPLAAISGFFVLRAGLHPVQLVGLVVVLGGVALANRERQKHGGALSPVE